MATPEDDISILTSANDTAEDYVDEADILSEHFSVHSITPSTNASLQVFRNAYDDLKQQYNNLYVKCQNLERKNKEYENQLSSYATDIQTGSFLMVNDPSETSIAEMGTLRGRVKELERKLMMTEVNLKTVNAEKAQLQEKLDSVGEKGENVSILESKVKHLQERLLNYESKERNMPNQNQLTDYINEIKKLKSENLELLQQTRKLTDENVILKRQMYSKNPNPVVLNNGTDCSLGFGRRLVATGASKEVANDQQPLDLSLTSSLPAVDELEQLKHVIKKLKTVVQTQNAYLIKLDGNPAVRKLLREEQLGLSMNRSALGGASISGSNSSLNRESGKNECTDGAEGNFRQVSPVGNYQGVKTNHTWTSSRNGRSSPERLQVTLPMATEQYDNLHNSHRNLRQYQSKSQSEVISRTTSDLQHKDLHRSHSHTISRTSRFNNESANPREDLYGYDRTDNGTSTVVDPIRMVAASSPSPQKESERIPSIKTCPVCNADFTHKTVTEFQTHVFNCVDSEDQLNTLTSTCESDPERICPMCNHYFPPSCPQLEVDNHVNAHFGETPADAFEILSP